MPIVCLPGNGQTISNSASCLASLLSEHESVFSRDGVPVVVKPVGTGGGIELDVLKPAVATTLFESVAELEKLDSKGNPKSAICSETSAKLMLVSDSFKSRLPKVEVVAHCPVLTQLADGILAQITGYNEEKRILSAGKPIDEPGVEEAKQMFEVLLKDFRFATPGDKSRAIAAIITPAMVQGGLLGGRPPVDLGEADQSQAGKGYRNKILSAIYNERPKIITPRTGGVGSLDEAVADALIKGFNFVSIDNIRGKIDSPMIESALTEDTANARVPYGGNADVKTDRINLMMTSNKAQLTEDLANRTSCVRIRKQPQGYAYQRFPEGDLLAHVRANWMLCLGAVFAIIRAWHAAGMPRTNESRHDFRDWAQRLDWIVRNIFGEAPLLDGHAEIRGRLTDPTTAWIREVAFAVESAGMLDTPLRAHQLADIITDHGGIELPGHGTHESVEDDAVQKKINQAIGRRMTRFFTNAEIREVEGFKVSRVVVPDDNYRETKTYQLSRLATLSSRVDPASSVAKST